MAGTELRDVLEAKAAWDRELLNEVSLGRVYKHVSDGQSFGILTAYRAGNPAKTNRELFKKLQGDLRALGLGFFKLQGHWQECQDSSIPYAKCPKDQLQDAAEPSLFVPGIKRADIDRLGKKYDQDAVVYSGEETDRKVTLLFRDGATQAIGEFSPGKVAQAYSKLRGASFVFEYVVQTHAESLIAEAWAKSRPSLPHQIAELRDITGLK